MCTGELRKSHTGRVKRHVLERSYALPQLTPKLRASPANQRRTALAQKQSTKNGKVVCFHNCQFSTTTKSQGIHTKKQ